MLIRKFSKCSVNVKCYLCKTYCLTMHCSTLWFNSTKTALTKLKIAYNNSLRRLLGLPKYNSASEMFVNLGILSFGKLLRKFFFSFKTRISASHNSCLQSIYMYNYEIPLFSKIWALWEVILTIYNIFVLSDMSKFIFYFILLISIFL